MQIGIRTTWTLRTLLLHRYIEGRHPGNVDIVRVDDECLPRLTSSPIHAGSGAADRKSGSISSREMVRLTIYEYLSSAVDVLFTHLTRKHHTRTESCCGALLYIDRKPYVFWDKVRVIAMVKPTSVLGFSKCNQFLQGVKHD